ncbi:Glucose--fructose oxidoreductase precursor [Posidoniimonas polymericola]|uniref:Glucose--fructose oxidoreductase n=1 Tax=Posidoniimonas polymericola TaxID=2528002 RepID=A0A5C5YIG7_9BACT|nr:Gfo/Idh/MocA family oxidoreductase [Posidoniimonas polymericola]TWT74668.1 Glucose--fructose oxidoreductase precursor [Posidoniimonas polymericola]
MKHTNLDRRGFIKAGALTAGAGGLLSGGLLPGVASAEDTPPAPNDKIRFGFVGTGDRFMGIFRGACQFGPAIALADVDAVHRGRAYEAVRDQNNRNGHGGDLLHFEDYRRVLDRDDIDAVMVVTPDHWHSKIVIEAMQSGKDVYCEKPLTLTIREGQQILETIDKTGRVLQVGTQQRTEMGQMFAKATALVHHGRVGKLQHLTCAIGGSLPARPIPVIDVPAQLNWERWQGQTPLTDFRADAAYGSVPYNPNGRAHYTFRWFYEYSGGKLTDWGAHHVDIAMWAAQKSGGPVGRIEIDPLEVNHPVPFKDGYPTQDDRFNCATSFKVRCTFEDGLVMDIRDRADDLGFDNGILFEGDKQRLFVNRGKLTGAPVEELKDNPLPDDYFEQLYGRPAPKSHMGDFVDSIRSRRQPISDAASHHRALSVCHATNIAMRLGRKLVYDTDREQFVDDPQADSFIAREQREGYEINV